MKITFNVNLETEATRETLNEAIAEAGVSIEEYEVLLRMGIKQQLQAAMGDDDTKVVVSKLEITFNEDAGAGQEELEGTKSGE